MADPPPAEGQRLPWFSSPEHVRETVEQWLGSRIVEARDMPGGFSPGVAARLLTVGGDRVFCKAVGPEPNPTSPEFHLREALIAAALPSGAPVAHLLWSRRDEESGWVTLILEDIDGVQPATPWRRDELDRVLDAIGELAGYLTPSPVPTDIAGNVSDWRLLTTDWWGLLAAEMPAELDDWSRRHLARLAGLATGAPRLAGGSALLHLDIRADNVLLTPDRVYVVDWPHARIGAAWLESICFAPSVTMQGGPHPEEILRRHPAFQDTDPAAIDAALATITGYFIHQGLQPPPPGLPTVRAFQAAQGAVARGWLAERLGWS